MNDTLQHHGVPGQKWGVRRYQNKDGSLTPAGKKRADKIKSKYSKLRDEYTGLTGKRLMKKPSPKTPEQNKPKTKTVDEMTIEELRSKTTRLNAEKDYIEAVRNRNSLTPKQTSKGKEFMKKVMDEAIIPAAMDTGKQIVKSYMVKYANKKLKFDNEHKIYTNNQKKK